MLKPLVEFDGKLDEGAEADLARDLLKTLGVSLNTLKTGLVSKPNVRLSHVDLEIELPAKSTKPVLGRAEFKAQRTEQGKNLILDCDVRCHDELAKSA